MTLQHNTDDLQLSRLTRAYLTADYRWAQRNAWLPVEIGSGVPALEAAYPDATSFGMISAWNPWSVQLDDEANRRADVVLHDLLLTRGIECCPAFASAPNRSWREPSWMVMGMGQGEFNALVTRFRQLGTLWWPRGGAVRLRMDAQRPGDIDPDALIDWLR